MVEVAPAGAHVCSSPPDSASLHAEEVEVGVFPPSGVAPVGVDAVSVFPRPKRLPFKKGTGKAPLLPKRAVANVIVNTPALKKGLKGLRAQPESGARCLIRWCCGPHRCLASYLFVWGFQCSF